MAISKLFSVSLKLPCEKIFWTEVGRTPSPTSMPVGDSVVSEVLEPAYCNTWWSKSANSALSFL